MGNTTRTDNAEVFDNTESRSKEYLISNTYYTKANDEDDGFEISDFL
jgi:hypothetical protein